MPLLPAFPFIGSFHRNGSTGSQKAESTAEGGSATSSLPALQGAEPRDPSSSRTKMFKAADQEDDINSELQAPKDLHTGYDPTKVLPWDEARFKNVQLIADAKRNRGMVNLMKDEATGRSVAVKQMPNWWICKGHGEFLNEHPSETELPWQDIGCTQFLNDVSFAPACQLYNVYRSPSHTFVVTSFATEGDLFTQCQVGAQPGPERELAVAPLVVQILAGIKNLHDLSIAHRDISLENILVTKPDGGGSHQEIRIIDYSMASTGRIYHSVRGKASYQAPEMHSEGQQYDAFLADTFSVGVTLYALLMMDYPWQATKPQTCKCFEYVKANGFRSYTSKRKIRGSNYKVAERMSEPLAQLLEGMLALDPASRLTLGERSWSKENRKSVWDMPWTKKAWEQAVHAGLVPPAFLPRSVSL